MRKRWFIIPGLLATLIGCLSQLPLSWVVPKSEINGQIPNYGGTIWEGYVDISGFGLINIDSSLSRLLSGRNPVLIEGGQPGLRMEAEADLSGLRRLNIEGAFPVLASRDVRLRGVQGDFKLEIPDMKLMKQCEYADGTVWTDFLSKNVDRLRWKGPVLEGPVKCEDGNLILSLSGKDNLADISADMTIFMDGIYQADIVLTVDQTIDQYVEPVLRADGFQKSGNSYKLTEQGRWQ